MRRALRAKRIVVSAVLLMMMLFPCFARADYASKVIDRTVTQEEKAGIPPILQGKAFGLYYKGAAVEVVKMRLQELGYYQPMLTFHDKFDDLLRIRVRAFQRNNGLEEHGRIDEPTLCALYAENPVKGEWYVGKNTEPDVTLIIPITKSAQWYQSAENEIGFRVTVKNISARRTLTAYEVMMYAVDGEGNTLHEVPSLVMTGKIHPGETAWTSYMMMENPDAIHSVYVALKRVRYDDGSYVIVDEPVYDCFILQEGEKEAEDAADQAE